MPADRHQAATFPADETLGQGQVDDRLDVVDAVNVLGDTHAPDEHGLVGRREALGQVTHDFPLHAGRLFELLPPLAREFLRHSVKTGRVAFNERSVNGAAFDQVLDHAVQERHVGPAVD